MIKYEYLVQHLPMKGSYVDHGVLLNELAKQGWRLVAVDNGIYFFERQSVDPNSNTN
jgi:hypothetical protein